MNRSRALLVLAVLAVFLSGNDAHALGEKSRSATSVATGETWKRLDSVSPEWANMFKICLIRGIYEGAFSMDPKNAFEQYGPLTTWGDLVKSLDRFYAQPANQKIPVTYALVMISANPKGELPKVVEIEEQETSVSPALVSKENGIS